MLKWVLMSFLLVSYIPVQAGSFKVFPLKLSFDQQQKTALFRITNTGEDVVTVQLEGMQWSQDKDGEDVYTATRDIIFFPKIVKVQKNEERVVRVAYKRAGSELGEKSYRLFAQELPQRGSSGGALSFALRFSVPIFVKGTRMQADPILESVSLRNGQVEMRMVNRGNAHYLVSDIQLEGIDNNQRTSFQLQNKGWYVLPEKQRVFKILVDEQACRKSHGIQVRLTVKNKVFKDSIMINPAECARIQSAQQ